MNITTATSVNGTDKPNARTGAALQRLHKAMRDMEAEIETNHGVYPFNPSHYTQVRTIGI